MSNDPDTFHRVLGEAPPPAEVERRIVDGALQHMQSPSSGKLVWGGLALAGAAAGIVLVLWLGGFIKSQAPQHRRGKGKTTRPEPIAAGKQWTTTKTAQHHAIGPHRAELGQHSSMRLVKGTASSPRLELRRGRARFQVKPLEAGRTFEVRTPQVRVVVVGTLFSVELRSRCTHVKVTSGKVQVTSAGEGEPELLVDGQQRTFCDQDRDPDRNQLGQAGRQVRRAISLVREGRDLGQAEGLLTSYLEKSPNGTYAEEAHYFLVLVKRRLGKQREAVEQARAFLKRFPGTARAVHLRRWLEKEPP